MVRNKTALERLKPSPQYVSPRLLLTSVCSWADVVFGGWRLKRTGFRAKKRTALIQKVFKTKALGRLGPRLKALISYGL